MKELFQKVFQKKELLSQLFKAGNKGKNMIK